jgi:hypothetical protein
MTRSHLPDRMMWLWHPKNRWRTFVFLGVFAYLLLIDGLVGLRPDHGLLAFFICCLALGKAKSKRFLFDWAPFILFWIAYDLMRGVTDALRYTVNVAPPYRLELFLFGPLFGGQIPNFYFQYFQVIHEGALGKILLDIMGAVFYVLHFVAHLILGWILWHSTADRPLFYHFIYTITVLSVLALATFIIYPAAPPWYVYKYGLALPNGTVEGSAASLINFDRLIGMNVLQWIWNNFNSNLFAAIPSLHAAHAVAIAFFGMKKFRQWRPLWLIHPIGTWFSAVYLNEHYIIDLVIGLVYLIVAYCSVKWLIYPKVFKKAIEGTTDT